MNDENDGEPPPALPAFSACGIELEYMIVDRERLSVLPIADRLLGENGEVDRGLLGWSNELVLHVLEIKNRQPAASLDGLPEAFQSEVRELNRQLQPMNARLMPGAMHPWMNPRTETRLWPHDDLGIYRAYERIFDTRSHGWANLQSMHINLPFADEQEFARLHAAIRLALPILPALAASSPFVDGRRSGWTDYRMRVYCDNAQAFPSIAGMVIPETITHSQAYRERILAPMFRDIAPHDPDKLLQQEWLNSRGAIARFDRNAIEIRVIDTQECPRADLAIAGAAIALVRILYDAGKTDLAAQQEMPTPALAAILQACIRDAELALIDQPHYLRLLGIPGDSCIVKILWEKLMERMPEAQRESDVLHTILQHGPLARRLLRTVGEGDTKAKLPGIYQQLCDCLEAGRLFLPG
jgi:carboxylate-amine ligase